MVNQSLRNKKVIISAGASGIGWATAKVCLDKGAIVFICDVDKKHLLKAKKHKLNKKKLFVYECDASDENKVKELFTQINKKTKKIDCLVNNVGVAGPTGTIEKLKSEDWENTLKVNVISHFYFTKLAIPMLKKNKGGSIINLSSGAGIMGFPLRSPYAASKWAIVGVTKTLAMELGKYKIRVNAICIGLIKSAQWERKAHNSNVDTLYKELSKKVPMGKVGEEIDFANLVAFLSSDRSSFITGTAINLDGGMCPVV